MHNTEVALAGAQAARRSPGCTGRPVFATREAQAAGVRLRAAQAARLPCPRLLSETRLMPIARVRAWLMPAVATLAFGSVMIAWGLQHLLDMQPCAWCIFQRLLYLLAGLFALLTWLSADGARFAFGLLGLSVAIGGVTAALWQQFVASASGSCDLTFADRVIKGLRLDEWAPSMFKATAFCHEANLPLLGVPFAWWSAALFLVLVDLFVLDMIWRHRASPP